MHNRKTCSICLYPLKEYVGLNVVEQYCDNKKCKAPSPHVSDCVTVTIPRPTEPYNYTIVRHPENRTVDVTVNVKLAQAIDYVVTKLEVSQAVKEMFSALDASLYSCPIEALTGSDLDKFALGNFGIQRFIDESEEDFCFRITALLED